VVGLDVDFDEVAVEPGGSNEGRAGLSDQGHILK
jgi:hypothetical protein